MSIVCPAPDGDLGVALRLTQFVDCQARALGENGFLAFIGGPVAGGLLSGLVTIFVALIGYRFLLDGFPSLRQGIGWFVRLGIVMALVTGWPAFQTLVYRVAVDAPGQLAAVILPASGLPSEDLPTRVQNAYDTMRLGAQATQPVQQPPPPQNGATAQPGQQQTLQPPQPGLDALPQTASLFVVSTSGVLAATQLAVGFLLAVAPLALLALLFDATLGVFNGWVRALVGAALATLAATITTAVALLPIESELGRLQLYRQGGMVAVVDPQALTTMVLAFAVVMLVTVVFAGRMAGAFGISAIMPGRNGQEEPRQERVGGGAVALAPTSRALVTNMQVAEHGRAAAVADALAANVRREQRTVISSTNAVAARDGTVAGNADAATHVRQPLGVAGRRAAPRRSRSAARRDRV